MKVIESYIANGWLEEHDSLESLTAAVGGTPIFNKFACLTKVRSDGTCKRRIIMDARRSGVTASSRKMYKAVLPRQTDLVQDTLRLLSGAKDAESVDYMVLDADDAFWQVPLHPKERRFYCAMLRDSNGKTRFLSYARTPQGSRGAPLSWSQTFGLVCRCVSSVVRDPVIPDAHEMEVYVDDPILVLRGTTSANTEGAALAILTWAVLGVGLSFKKGQFGPKACLLYTSPSPRDRG